MIRWVFAFVTVIVAGAVAVFAIYTFAWRDDDDAGTGERASALSLAEAVQARCHRLAAAEVRRAHADWRARDRQLLKDLEGQEGLYPGETADLLQSSRETLDRQLESIEDDPCGYPVRVQRLEPGRWLAYYKDEAGHITECVLIEVEKANVRTGRGVTPSACLDG